MRIVCRCSASVKPGSTLRNAAKVRIISTALTRSTSAMATCAITSTLRERCRSRPALAVRAAPGINAAARIRTYFKAGMDPNNRPENTDSASVNASELASSEISLKRGRSAGPIATRSRSPAYATPTASTPPISPNAVLSTSSSRAMRARPAPSAARIESSCCRASARTSSRFATLVQAISITNPTVAITTHSTLPTLPITCCLRRRRFGVILHVS